MDTNLLEEREIALLITIEYVEYGAKILQFNLHNFLIIWKRTKAHRVFPPFTFVVPNRWA